MWTIILPALVLTAAQAPPQLPNPEDIERAAVAQRRSLTSGSLKIETTSSDGDSTTKTVLFDYWFEGGQTRCDMTRLKNGVVEYKGVESFDFERDGYYVMWDYPLASDQKRVLTVRKAREDSRKKLFSLINFRLIGLIPEKPSMLGSYHFQSYLLYPDQKDLSIEAGNWQALDCWIVRSTRNDDVKIETWIVPKRDYNVVRLKVSYAKGKESSESTVDSELRQWGANKIWFPSRCVLRTVRGDKVQTSVTEIQEASFNQPLPPDAFKIAGLHLPQGTLVIDEINPKQDIQIWDGSQLITPPPFDGPTELPAKIDDQPSARRKWLIGLCIAFAVAGAAIAGYYFFRSGGKGASPA